MLLFAKFSVIDVAAKDGTGVGQHNCLRSFMVVGQQRRNGFEWAYVIPVAAKNIQVGEDIIR